MILTPAPLRQLPPPRSLPALASREAVEADCDTVDVANCSVRSVVHTVVALPAERGQVGRTQRQVRFVLAWDAVVRVSLAVACAGTAGSAAIPVTSEHLSAQGSPTWG